MNSEGNERLSSLIAQGQLEHMRHLAASVPPGAFVEIGVFEGGSAQYLYEIAERQNRALHLFDTFAGLPFYTEGLDSHRLAEFEAPQAPQAIANLMPHAKVHVGIYPETHPHDLGPVAFIHCDCDQYLSYRAVIDRMWPVVVPGGIMLFDDYPDLAGAKKAVEESFGPESLHPCGDRYFVRK